MLYIETGDKFQERRFQERVFILTDTSRYDALMGNYFFSSFTKPNLDSLKEE